MSVANSEDDVTNTCSVALALRDELQKAKLTLSKSK